VVCGLPEAHRSGERLLLSDGWLTLGHYPDMPLAQARIEARQARVLLEKQQGPLAVPRAADAEQRQRGSFRELCEEWYQTQITARGLKHPEVPRRHLDKYLLPGLGRAPADGAL